MTLTLPAIDYTPLRVRWEISQKTAEAYLHILNGEMEAFSFIAAVIRVQYESEGSEWPESMLNYMRIYCLAEYLGFLRSGVADTSAVLRTWDKIILTATERPWPGWEIEDHLQCIKVALLIMSAAGLIKLDAGAGLHPIKVIAPPASVAFGRCLMELGKVDAGRSIWRREGRLVHQYRIIHAEKRYGPGGIKAEWKEVYLRLVGKMAVESVIDFGCGRSKDIVQLWPHAKHAFYDPAIPGMEVLPAGPFTLGYCTQVMEHIPEDELTATLEIMRELTPTWVMSIHMAPATQILPNGENAHCTQHDAEWWKARLKPIFGYTRTEPMDRGCFYLTTLP